LARAEIRRLGQLRNGERRLQIAPRIGQRLLDTIGLGFELQQFRELLVAHSAECLAALAEHLARDTGREVETLTADLNSPLLACVSRRVLPGATATDFCSTQASLWEQLPPEIVMTAHDLVDAALVGFDRGEVVTIPSLADAAEWDVYEGARKAMMGHLSSATHDHTRRTLLISIESISAPGVIRRASRAPTLRG
jgi:hypothetical protein